MKMQCDEIKARINYQTMSADQKRFTEQELKACQDSLIASQHRDSSTIEKLESRLSPQEDSL